MLAKIKDNKIIKFPYTIEDLQQENPYTEFGLITDWITTYAATEIAINEGSYLVDIKDPGAPENQDIYKKIIRNEIPVYNGEEWVIEYDIVDKTEEDLIYLAEPSTKTPKSSS